MNTEIFKAVALSILSLLIIVAGWRGIKARHIVYNLGRPPVLAVQLSDTAAQITSIFYVIAGLLMLPTVALSLWYEGQDLDTLMYLFAGGSIATMIFGLFIGTVIQAAINVGEQLRKRTTSTAHQNDDSSE